MRPDDEEEQSPEELRRENARIREGFTRLQRTQSQMKERWAKAVAQLRDEAKRARQARERSEERARHQVRTLNGTLRLLEGEIATLTAALEASRARRLECVKLAQMLVAATDENPSHTDKESRALLERALRRARTIVALEKSQNGTDADPR